MGKRDSAKKVDPLVNQIRILRDGVVDLLSGEEFEALIRRSLVAMFFMHLVSEKQIIFGILLLTTIFFIALLMIPAYG